MFSWVERLIVQCSRLQSYMYSTALHIVDSVNRAILALRHHLARQPVQTQEVIAIRRMCVRVTQAIKVLCARPFRALVSMVARAATANVSAPNTHQGTYASRSPAVLPARTGVRAAAPTHALAFIHTEVKIAVSI